MAKPTSLASQLKRDDEAAKLARDKEDIAAAGQAATPGKVWVRLERPHYDADNVLHMPGITQLFADAVPRSAKVLSAVEAEAEIAEDEGDAA